MYLFNHFSRKNKQTEKQSNKQKNKTKQKISNFFYKV